MASSYLLMVGAMEEEVIWKAAGDQWFVVGRARDGWRQELAASQSLIVPNFGSFRTMGVFFRKWFIQPYPPTPPLD